MLLSLNPQWLGPFSGPGPTPQPPNTAQTPAGPVRSGEPPLASFAPAVGRALPAVVSVYTTKEINRPRIADPFLDRFFGERFGLRPERQLGLGSGVIANTEGYVLTNYHVVQAADEILVALADGRRIPAKIIGADPETDLAVLRIEAPELPAITFGRSEELAIGDVVLAIGNPFNVGQTVTMGIVSALGRKGLDLNLYESFIQTDAAINQGNSGGALVDVQGNLVGINAAIYSGSGTSIGIGFAIPTTIIKQVMEQLIKTGKVVRGYFGIEAIEITSEIVDTFNLPQDKGVFIKGVARRDPAGRAGMQAGDVMISINGQPVTDRASMLNQIAALAPGSTARVKVLREGKETELAVVVGERPSSVPHR
ncbi:MAG TPA: trypsin-like peptidase domain-containing protein [Burkholderiaceae bacterium]|nr:trypsin-like peptidase domain-containing protein [Burkholderiaceae bacterium]